MPGARPTLTRGQLRAHLAAHEFRAGTADLVGAEVELTPLAIDGDVGSAEVRAAIDRLWDDLAGAGEGLPAWHGGSLTREPGGQLEYSGPPLATPEEAAESMTRAVRGLRALARRRGIELAAVGVHPWASPESIGLRTLKPRYRAMQAYFDRINHHGRRMMRQTGSVQACVDLGSPGEARERWELAQRLAPVLAAIFANGAVWAGRPGMLASLRGYAWTCLDLARTGVPRGFLVDSDGDPIDHYLDFALSASVMFVVEPDGRHEVPEPSHTFATWMREGLQSGYPTAADWSIHLSTLFPNVRPRGYLEFRTIDAPGLAWMGVPVMLAGHALRDGAIRRRLLERLRPHHESLPVQAVRAAISGLGDPILLELARAVMAEVRPRLSGPSDALVAAFDERYTSQGRTPGQELAERIAPGRRLDPADLHRLEHERVGDIDARLRAATEALGAAPAFRECG